MSENNLQISRNSQKNNKSNKNQEGPRNVHKYSNNRKSNKDFSC